MANRAGNKQKKYNWRKILYFATGAVLLGCCLYLAVPVPQLYETYSFSSAVYDRNGKLLKLSLSLDDKYRLFVSAARSSKNNS